MGDIIQFENKISKELETCLFMSKKETSEGYDLSTIQKCNNTLKFYNKSNILCSVPCIFGNGNINSDETKFMSLASGHYLVTIPSGYIGKSDSLRFILNGSAYKTIGVDNSINGLVKIEIIDDAKNDKDDFINGIAWNDTNPVHNYSIDILNGAEQTVKYGETLALNVQVKDNGVIISPTPLLIFETSNGLICTVNESGIVLATNSSGSATITVKLTDNINIYAKIIINDAPSSVVNYSYTLVGNIQPDSQISYNQATTYSATKYDNSNNIIPSQFTFQVVGNTPTNKYQLTIINSTQCSIKCLGFPYTITLRALDINNGQYYDKVITMKSLV